MWNWLIRWNSIRAKPTTEHDQRVSIAGGLKDTVKVAPGVGLTEPTGALWAVSESAATEPKQ